MYTIWILFVQTLRDLIQIHFIDRLFLSIRTSLALIASRFPFLAFIASSLPHSFLLQRGIYAFMMFFSNFSLRTSFPFSNNAYCTLSELDQSGILFSVFRHSGRHRVTCIYPWQEVQCYESFEVDARILERRYKRAGCGNIVYTTTAEMSYCHSGISLWW